MMESGKPEEMSLIDICKEELQELCLDEANRITKVMGLKLMKVYGRIEKEVDVLKLRTAYLEGRLDKREELT